MTQWVQRAGGGVHAYLGTLVDEPLSFAPQVAACESKGDKGIVMLKAAHVASAPWPVMSLLPERVLLRVATGAEVLLAGEQWEKHLGRLDKMQARVWQAALIGMQVAGLSWVLILEEAGIRKRLSTQVLENAAMAQERLRQLPKDHPGRLVEDEARAKETTWAGRTRKARENYGIEGGVGEQRAQSRAQLKERLKGFRREEVQPGLEKYRDNEWWVKHGREEGRHHIYYHSLGGSSVAVVEKLIRSNVTAEQWRCFAEWRKARLLWVSGQEGDVVPEEEPCKSEVHEGQDAPPTATVEHLLECLGNQEWLRDIDARIAEKVGGESETRASWLFRVDHSPAVDIRNIEMWGEIIRRKKSAAAGTGRGEGKRKEEAEEERIWTAFLKWMHDAMGPEWVQRCTIAEGAGHEV